jgi:hypothetical protein
MAEKEKKIKDIFEMGGETASFFERVAKEAGYEGYGRTAEVKESIKGKLFDVGKLKSDLNKIKDKLKIKTKNLALIMVKLYVAFLVSFYAFYPEIVQAHFWTLLIITILLIIIPIILAVILGVTGGGTAGVSFEQFGGSPANLYKDVIISFIILTLIVGVLISGTTSPNYSRLLLIRYSSLWAGIAFLVTVVISALIIVPGGALRLIAGTIIWCVLLFQVVPAILYIIRPGGEFCIPAVKKYIPLPVPLPECGEKLKKETMVFGGEMVTIPVGGGVSIEFGFKGAPRPLPAGQNYQEIFVIRNFYEKPIEVTEAVPSIVTTANNIEFILPGYTLQKSHFDPGEMREYLLTFDKDKISPSQHNTCLWPQAILEATEKETGVKSECAFDVPCPNNGICIPVANFVCKCTNWVNETCSGKPVYIKMNLTHTGFFKGNASLYYFDTYQGEVIKYPELVQGPISMKANFIPNPYISRWYKEFVNNISLFVDFKAYSSDLTINSFNITPIMTTVTTIDYTHGLMFNETIGIKKLTACDGKELVEQVNSKRKNEFSGEICYFTPPFVELSVTKMATGETLVISNVTLDRIIEYCSLNKTVIEDYCKGITKEETIGIWAKDWCDVYTYIDSSGLCSILSGNQTESAKIERALKFTQILIEMDYISTDTFSSAYIKPYYTSACG